MRIKTLRPGELYAFEQWARRERARAQARLIQAGARWVSGALKSLFFHGPTARNVRRQVIHHG
jgi:hypothetical protein